MKKPIVVIGLLGPSLDSGLHANRWEKWRPTVSLGQHPELIVKRLELLYQANYEKLAKVVIGDFTSVSPETEIRSHHIEMKNPWDLEEIYGMLHDWARRYPFQPDREDYLIHITTGTHIAQICMFLLTESHYFPAKLIQTSPPPGRKGLTPGGYEIIDLDLSRYDHIASRFKQEQSEGTSFLKSGIETRNARFNQLIERIESVVIRSQDPILLCGPTGAGKSQLAERIYDLKKLRHQVKGRFVAVNCATLRGESAMSALFGHVKGAFTGANTDRAGLLRSADEGVLFLDEIGELGADEQAMLLRAIEEKSFLPFGSDKEVKSDFQLIAGTNRNLSSRVAQGEFREDLLARINLWSFTLPGLADRRDDIEPNLKYELELFANRTGERVTFNREASERFIKFALSPQSPWRGNFRDLNAAVVRMATLAKGGRITVDVADEEIGRLKESWGAGQTDRSAELVLHYLPRKDAEALDLFDRLQLEGVLKVCRESKSLSDAGRQLFATSRLKRQSPNDADRLRKFLGRFGLSWEDLQK
jgi:transcriptional regulatory protein RtcR